MEFHTVEHTASRLSQGRGDTSKKGWLDVGVNPTRLTTEDSTNSMLKLRTHQQSSSSQLPTIPMSETV